MENKKKLWLTLVPGIFVFLWSTGFIGAKFGLPYAGPYTFLFLRMAVTLVLLGVIIPITHSDWPSDKKSIFHLAISGTLVHGAFLGGVFSAIKAGMPAGISAMIVGLQPIVTMILTVVLTKVSFSRRQVSGVILGFIGIFGVLLGGKLTTEVDLISGINLLTVSYAVMALFGISCGTIYQKKYCEHTPLLTGAFIQYTATAIIMGGLAYRLETMEFVLAHEFIFALLWLVVGLSISAILLLLFMIKEGEVARVASLFYLVPPLTAIESYVFFDERLSIISLIGIALSVFGVYLVLAVPKGKGKNALT
ncbi:MAG: DMT family transporter [SAR324 cluster bacterium]|nr:DMT family transporter [SAR324 cluster bacterium]